jgi:2-polyprenyl-3-methyl-5-hydroxy-6-metoxy-1,4-benzoquinol methylase
MQNILSAMPSTAPWYETWFDTQFYQSLYSHRNAGEAAAFIDRLKGRLLLPSDSAVLDLGCGAGRHARQLAACGFQVLASIFHPHRFRKPNSMKGADSRFAGKT